MTRRFGHSALILTVFALCSMTDSGAGEKLSVTVLVKDGLTAPNQAVTIEAKLAGRSLFGKPGVGGEPVELLVAGEVVATAMTGGDGRAMLTYVPKKQGVMPVVVRVGASPRVAAAQGGANLAVWERRAPIIAVEQAALIEPSSVAAPLPGVGLQSDAGPKPYGEAATELIKLTQFYYRVMYVVPPGSGDGFQAIEEARTWLKAHDFPAGYVVALPAGRQALGEKLDQLHADGWRSLKIGIARSATFAEAFIQRRLDAVIVPEPKKGEAPRKAKIAKDWKEVRKKL